MAHKVFIGLGGNLANPEQQVRDAIKELDQLKDSSLLAASSLYRSKPVGPQDQPDFINAVVKIETSLSPIKLLDALQQLEQDHGRVRKRHWGERTLDLDILLIDDLVIDLPRLKVPHPFATERSFVMFPLQEIAPDLTFPDNQTVQAICQQLELDIIKL